MTPLLIFIGAGFGGLLRYASNVAFAGFSTMFVNITGALFMGLAMAWLMPKAPENETLRLFLTTGILGGFTTFSAFSYDAYNFYMRGDTMIALLYVLFSILLSILALVIGVWIAKTYLL
jgi:fluoride exporter